MGSSRSTQRHRAGQGAESKRQELSPTRATPATTPRLRDIREESEVLPVQGPIQDQIGHGPTIGGVDNIHALPHTEGLLAVGNCWGGQLLRDVFMCKYVDGGGGRATF